MYETMLVFDNYDLLSEMQNLNIWGEPSGFEIATVVRDGMTAYWEMKRMKYDLVIAEIAIFGMDGLELLRKAKAEGLCQHFVLCSETVEFNYARQGIIFGAYDYFVRPFSESLCFSLFRRIQEETLENKVTEEYYSEEVFAFFRDHDRKIHEYVPDMLGRIYGSEADIFAADKKVRQIYSAVIDKVFAENEWLDLYLNQEDFYALDNINEKNGESYRKFYEAGIVGLFREFAELFPKVKDEKIHEVILYILDHPEDDLRQKTIAAKLYLNTSYLSTVFTAHVGMRFVDYLTGIKLKRAAWLLRNTSLKLSEIAARLGYKDMAYFSRLFKKQYKRTPTEYRVVGRYDI